MVLGRIAEPLAHFRARGHRVEAEDLQGPLIGTVQPEDHAEQGGLARTVGPEQPGDTALHGERRPVERRGRAPPLDDTLATDDGVGTHVVSIVRPWPPVFRSNGATAQDLLAGSIWISNSLRRHG